MLARLSMEGASEIALTSVEKSAVTTVTSVQKSAVTTVTSNGASVKKGNVKRTDKPAKSTTTQTYTAKQLQEAVAWYHSVAKADRPTVKVNVSTDKTATPAHTQKVEVKPHQRSEDLLPKKKRRYSRIEQQSKRVKPTIRDLEVLRRSNQALGVEVENPLGLPMSPSCFNLDQLKMAKFVVDSTQCLVSYLCITRDEDRRTDTTFDSHDRRVERRLRLVQLYELYQSLQTLFVDST